jgi:hypothetical protein
VIDPAKCSDQWYNGYAKAYNRADENGLPVPVDVAQQILTELTNSGRNKLAGIRNNQVLDLPNDNTYSSVKNVYNDDEDSLDDEYVSNNKAYGEPMPVQPVSCGGDKGCLNLTHQQTKLLKTVVEYLNQASTALYFSNNRFLSSAAKDLAAQLGDQFCVG